MARRTGKKARGYTSRRKPKTGRKKTRGYYVDVSFLSILDDLFKKPKSKKKRS